MITLQNLTDAYGHWMADQKGTSVEFTCSTDFSKMPESLRQYRTKALVHKIIYDADPLPTNKNISGLDQWYDNATQADQSSTFSTSYTETRSLGWTLEEGIEIGIELSTTQEVPAVASGTETVKSTVNFRSTAAGSIDTTREVSVNIPVAIPAMSSVRCVASILEQEYNIKFTAIVGLSGSLGVCFTDPVTMYSDQSAYRYWAVDLRPAVAIVRGHTSIDLRGYEEAGDGTIQVTTRGVFKGAQKTNLQVKSTQFPLRSTQTPDNPGKAIMQQYLLPMPIGAN